MGAGLAASRALVEPAAYKVPMDTLTIVLLAAIALLILWLHRENIARLRAGTEPKVGSKS